VLWAEWNGRYRDTVRSYWKGDDGHTRDLAYRLCGSSDLYQSSGKAPSASINFITSHDGYTLRDLVSFSEKHNHANGEDNRDGDNNNHSWNWGREGLDAPEEILALRRRLQRNFLATLFLSQGVPMLRGGDEFGATQQGNNNAYCQDNEISWLDWKHGEHERRLRDFSAKLIHLRQEHPIFRQPRFFQGRDLRGEGVKDITWIDASGAEMSDEAWRADFAKIIGVMLSGDSLVVRDFFGNTIRDDTFLLFFNAHHEDFAICLPGEENVQWRLLIDTADEAGFVAGAPMFNGAQEHTMTARSFCLFEQATGSDDEARTIRSREANAKKTGPRKR
jgi:glycogen operon protein